MKKWLVTSILMLFVSFACAQLPRVHFYSALGLSNASDALETITRLGYKQVMAGGSGDFYDISIYENVTVEGATFGRCILKFYKNKFWKIFYYDLKGDPDQFASRLEQKYSDYSVSEYSCEYKDRTIEISFDGSKLLCLSNSITEKLVRDISGGSPF